MAKLAPSVTQKFVQGVVAVACVTKMSEQHTPMKLALMYEVVFQYYHGYKSSDKGGHVESLLDQFLEGKGPFDTCWVTQTSSNQKLLNSAMARGDIIVNGVSVTKTSLERAKQTSPARISGRTIYNAAMKNIKEAKKMLACERSFLNDGLLPSGQNEEDLMRFTFETYVRKHFTSKATHVADSDDEDEDGDEDGNADCRGA